MTVDVLEAVELAVARGHELDHADGGVAGDPGRSLELGPVTVVVFEIAAELGEYGLDAPLLDPANDIAHTNELHHGNASTFTPINDMTVRSAVTMFETGVILRKTAHYVHTAFTL